MLSSWIHFQLLFLTCPAVLQGLHVTAVPTMGPLAIMMIAVGRGGEETPLARASIQAALGYPRRIRRMIRGVCACKVTIEGVARTNHDITRSYPSSHLPSHKRHLVGLNRLARRLRARNTVPDCLDRAVRPLLLTPRAPHGGRPSIAVLSPQQPSLRALLHVIRAAPCRSPTARDPSARALPTPAEKVRSTP